MVLSQLALVRRNMAHHFLPEIWLPSLAVAVWMFSGCGDFARRAAPHESQVREERWWVSYLHWGHNSLLFSTQLNGWGLFFSSLEVCNVGFLGSKSSNNYSEMLQWSVMNHCIIMMLSFSLVVSKRWVCTHALNVGEENNSLFKNFSGEKSLYFL